MPNYDTDLWYSQRIDVAEGQYRSEILELWDSVIRYDDGQTGMSPPLGSGFLSPGGGLLGGPLRLNPL
jgi:hypothetical protein